MLTFDRIVLTMLALGIWALVLTPRSIDAHHKTAEHDCQISGKANGVASGQDVEVYDWTGVLVSCEH